MTPQAIAYDEDAFNLAQMGEEIRSGIHRYRKRTITSKQAVQVTLEKEFKFF